MRKRSCITSVHTFDSICEHSNSQRSGSATDEVQNSAASLSGIQRCFWPNFNAPEVPSVLCEWWILEREKYSLD
jgi:hypothetical protein